MLTIHTGAIKFANKFVWNFPQWILNPLTCWNHKFSAFNCCLILEPNQSANPCTVWPSSLLLIAQFLSSDIKCLVLWLNCCKFKAQQIHFTNSANTGFLNANWRNWCWISNWQRPHSLSYKIQSNWYLRDTYCLYYFQHIRNFIAISDSFFKYQKDNKYWNDWIKTNIVLLIFPLF
jgi:hypothetical protein